MQYGLQPAVVCCLYLVVAVPSMLYAADTFLMPICKQLGSTHQYELVRVITKLGTVQWQAFLMMTGAMRTTAMLVLEAHTNILLFQLLVDKICQCATVQLCTFPMKTKMLYIKRASKLYVNCHCSALHELLRIYKAMMMPGSLEEIHPYCHHPH